MSMAIKYAMKKKMAQGGTVCAAHGAYACHMCHGGKMAEGGEAKFEEEEKASGYMPESEEHDEMNESPREEDEDMISRIMSKRYSEGGKVANDTSPEADFEDNDFDDLVKDDDLHENYTAENSGDEKGNAEIEDLMHDIVERVMRSRAKRDRNPVPA